MKIPGGRNTKRIVITIAAGLMLAGSLTACSGDQIKDLKGINSKDPQKTELYTNLDQHPNIVRLCIDGVALMTTTRTANGVVTRVPEWDAWCKQ